MIASRSSGFSGQKGFDSVLSLLPRDTCSSPAAGHPPAETVAFVFQGGGDRSLIEAVKRQQILGSRLPTHSLVELNQIAIRGKRFGMALFLVETLKDLSYFEQFRDSLAFACAQM